MKNASFYASGLYFSCKQCSACCRYESGFVFLSEKDLDNLAEALKMDRKSVLSVYCRWVTDWEGQEALSLKEKANKDCILWDRGCTVYASRPLQCITFPFWKSILSSNESWEIAASGCPGINAGQLHSEKAINQHLKTRDKEPVIRKGVV